MAYGSMVTSVQTSDRAGAYSARHPQSPIAAAADQVGAVLLADRMRVEVEHVFGVRELRRAYGLGVLSADATVGVAPDQHQVLSGLWPELNEDEYLVRWVGLALQSHSAEGDGWATTVAPAPATVDAYVLRLVCPDKAEYAAACADALAEGRAMPTSSAKWGEQVRVRVCKHWRRGLAAVAGETASAGEVF